jgi:hypothetical protein
MVSTILHVSVQFTHEDLLAFDDRFISHEDYQNNIDIYERRAVTAAMAFIDHCNPYGFKQFVTSPDPEVAVSFIEVDEGDEWEKEEIICNVEFAVSINKYDIHAKNSHSKIALMHTQGRA